MKQTSLFNDEADLKKENKYTSKIITPIYEPKNKKPFVIELYDTYKTNMLIREIEQSGVTPEEKKFLIEAARRHTIFNYSKIADYYAHSGHEMQYLMEHSALIIIDYEKAIEYGYIRLAEEIAQSFLEEVIK